MLSTTDSAVILDALCNTITSHVLIGLYGEKKCGCAVGVSPYRPVGHLLPVEVGRLPHDLKKGLSYVTAYYPGSCDCDVTQAKFRVSSRFLSVKSCNLFMISTAVVFADIFRVSCETKLPGTLCLLIVA